MNDKDLETAMEFFGNLEADRQILKSIGICQSYHQAVSRTRDGYMMVLENRIFNITSTEHLGFYDIIATVVLETLGNKWILNESRKKPGDRSEIYQIIGILGATGGFKKVISYEGNKIETSFPENGFSKSFLTLAFDIFCLRNSASLPKTIIDRLKHFDQYQGARYEITVAAIFCRLGYVIEWIDDRMTKEKHPEFIARKEGKEVYVEVKSRQVSGVHNVRGEFNESKASKSKGYGSLLNSALEKEKYVPKGSPYLIFIDINAVEDGKSIPKWIQQASNSLANQHLKKYAGTQAPFTGIIFTNYSYHYKGLHPPGNNICFFYENDITARPYFEFNQKAEILEAVRRYGFIPDYYIPPPMTILQRTSEYPRIMNLYQILR